MATNERKIEVCSNNEWLGLGGERYQDEAGSDWCNAVIRKLEEEFGYGVAIRAQGQRTLYHGWNGANTFERKGSGLGTFDTFTDAEWDRACAIADQCSAEVEAYWQERIGREDAEFAAEQNA